MTNLSEDRAYATNYFSFISTLNNDNSNANASVNSNTDQFAKNDVPEPAEQRELLKSFDQLKGHQPQLQSLAELCSSSLKQCSHHLRAGFNFLCYGYGRKQDLLNHVVSEVFDDYNIFSLSGCSETSINLGPIALFNCLLNSIYNSGVFPKIEGFSVNSSSSKATILGKTDLLLSSQPSQKCLILLHQMDSPAFRSPVLLDCLLKLVNSSNFSLIATIDNPNIINLLSKSRFEKFNWIWMDCTTMQPYTDELFRFALDSCNSSASKQTPRAAIIVLQSLTSNSRSIFKLLAAHQLGSNEAQVSFLIDCLEDEEDQDPSASSLSQNHDGYTGMSYHGLFQKCQENFVVTAEANFRTQLTEFTDHDLFKSIEGKDGSTMFFIPFYHSELRQIIQDI